MCIPGGLCPPLSHPPNQADADTQEMCDKVRGEFEQRINKTFEEYIAKGYRSQVVNGTNFFVKIQLGADYVHVRIYQPLPYTDKGPSLSAYQYPKTEADPIEYFEKI